MDWKKFSFDFKPIDYADWKLTGPIISIEGYKETAENLVLPPNWKEQLDRLNRVRAVYGTTALEGNPLSEAEVSHQIEILDKEGIDGGKTKITKEQLQIRNAGIAQQWVKSRFFPGARPLEFEDILKMHQLITQESDTKDNLPGKLRTHDVKVGTPEMGGVHKGAPPADLPQLMEQYIEFVNSKRLEAEHPVISALLAHFFLVTIHPFGDGNGRLSRLVEAGILYKHGYNLHGFYGLSNYFYRNEQSYKTLLQRSRDEQPFDVTAFIVFGLEGFLAELRGISNFLKTKMNRLVYREMLVRAFNTRMSSRRKLLNQREYSLLDFLLKITEPTDPFAEKPSKSVSFNELTQSSYIKTAYRDVTERTFYRELVRLSSLGFITSSKNAHSSELFIEIDFGAIGKY